MGSASSSLRAFLAWIRSLFTGDSDSHQRTDDPQDTERDDPRQTPTAPRNEPAETDTEPVETPLAEPDDS